ncbi:MAG: aminodeoxychorismate synthase component I [Bacteroidetes bacterium]|nr:MAG: aminodeoxychorismate synthase component I [Bacteroidota bacterium]
MKREQLIQKINHCATHHIPFLVIVDFDLEKPVLYTEEELQKEEIYFQTTLGKRLPEKGPLPHPIRFEKAPLPFPFYQKRFEKVQQHIDHGDTFLLNLTFPTTVNSNLSLRNIFDHSEAKYKLLYKNHFVCFSPETFVTIRGNKISSNPMKGTIDGTRKEARAILLSDGKELAEHHTIIDLIRNDLSMVASSVKVAKYRYIDTITTHEGTLLQMSSEIEGTLPDDFRAHLGELIFTLLPAGSISGAPKKKTVEVIHESEVDQRGYYTGIFAWYDGQNLDSAVIIRYLEEAEGTLRYRSGGGITTMSDARKEYEELIDKVYVPIV